MGINVKLQVFEGLLDLLLHLIDKNKVNIYDIPIAMITEQYMEYVNQMDKEDLNVVSEFLVMAATLLDIKSRMLLPKEVNEEGEEVQDILRTNKKFSFREMLSKNSSKVSVIVTFLVMLELIKTGFVEVHQESTFGDIDINVVKDPELIDEIIVEE